MNYKEDELLLFVDNKVVFHSKDIEAIKKAHLKYPNAIITKLIKPGYFAL